MSIRPIVSTADYSKIEDLRTKISEIGQRAQVSG